MAVKIRLSRIGKKHRPYWRVVAVDSRAKRDGAFLENLGTYDPMSKQLIKFDAENLEKWLNKGAICTASVVKLSKMYKKLNQTTTT
ncbi:30S ribosomal protein S16 [Candidatus Babeliales bacterium]|nr:30S ribosomal protein S16 [Candidatus Babeliales bacterium]